MAEQARRRDKTLWDTALKAMTPVTLGLVAQALYLWRDMAVIQATTVTESQLVAFEDRVLNELPPAWLRDDLREIKEAQAALTALVVKIAGLEVRLQMMVERNIKQDGDIDALENAVMNQGGK